ncbi:MAG TPA: GNAT family N-acetyltransferase [Gaiellaceae bacterium]|nr:GNAT family N-acetyltransferase [Gaiellaceae bacterium]
MIRLLDDARAFLDAAGPLLLTDEARHNLQLGITGTLVSSPDRYLEARFWVVFDGGTPVAAALRTPPFNLLLARPRDDEALDELVDGIEDELPGIVGAHPEVDAFIDRWARRRPIERRVLREQGVYALERVEPVPAASGAPRPATSGDEALLVEWMVAFGEEVLDETDPGRLEARATVEHRLESSDGGFELWVDGGEVVSVSGWGGPTPNGIRIGPVYTPPALRGRGYATALVAGLSQRLLDGGRQFCFLYTDLANPTSNAIYERIGYVKVCEASMVAFDPR